MDCLLLYKYRQLHDAFLCAPNAHLLRHPCKTSPEAVTHAPLDDFLPMLNANAIAIQTCLIQNPVWHQPCRGRPNAERVHVNQECYTNTAEGKKIQTEAHRHEQAGALVCRGEVHMQIEIVVRTHTTKRAKSLLIVESCVMTRQQEVLVSWRCH